MKLSKSAIYHITILLLLLFKYGFSLSQEHSLASNILSPAISIFATYIIFRVFRKARFNRLSWLIVALAGSSWVVADILWGYYIIFLKLNPSDMALFGYLYIIPTICLLGAQISYIMSKMKFMEKALIAVDLAIVVVLLLSVFWLVICDKDLRIVLNAGAAFITFLYVILDFTIIGLVFLIYLSFRQLKAGPYINVLNLGAAIYALTDICLQYSWIHNTYDLDSIIDGGYMLALTALAVGGLLLPKDEEHSVDCGDRGILKNQTNSWILLVPFVIFYSFRQTDSVLILIVVSIVCLHKIASSYI